MKAIHAFAVAHISALWRDYCFQPAQLLWFHGAIAGQQVATKQTNTNKKAADDTAALVFPK